jgi:hypothetical protein
VADLDKIIDIAADNRRYLVSRIIGPDVEYNPENVGLSIRDELKKLSDKFRDLTKTMEAQKMVDLGYFRNLDEALLRRNIEDGIINKLHEATPKQLDVITNKNNSFFIYYRDFYKEIEFFKIPENDN